MGIRGRKPKPTAIKVLTGNPGRRPLNKAEPQPGRAVLRVPKGKLAKDGQQLWRALAPQLDQLGVLKATDLPAFEMLCMHYELAREARKIVDAEGMTAKTLAPDQDGKLVVINTKKHPAAAILAEQSRLFKAYLTEFGLTPSSRVRIKADGQEREKSLAELLFEGIDE